MNRRSTLSTILGQNKLAEPFVQSPSNPATSFAPYEGEWNFEQAAHLLRRTMYGPKKEEIEEAVELGLAGTIERLFQEEAMPAPPINIGFTAVDPLVPVGEPWVGIVLSEGDDSLRQRLRQSRERSLYAWNFQLLVESGMSIREKMTLFWHNHFVVQNSTVRDPCYLYEYIELLRENATGNFKELVQKITINKAMLWYLNGNTNRKQSPNENFARELFELFTIGRGPLAGPGDYTTFTEDDVIEAARVLTGWRTTDYLAVDIIEEASFNPSLHDTDSKQFS